MRPSKTLIWLIFGHFLFAAFALSVAFIESWMQHQQTFMGFTLSDGLITLWQWLGWVLILIALIDLVSLSAIRHIHGERKIAQNIAVDAKTKIILTISNHSKRRLKVVINDHYPNHAEIEGLPFENNIPAGEFLEYTYYFRPLQRGDTSFEPIRLLIASRLGLWQGIKRTGEKDTVKVYPNFATIHHFLLLSIDQQLSQIGIRQHQRRGEGLDFHQLREYRQGDSLRQIDWSATSRLKKLISKEYQEEKDQNIIFLLDCGRRMRAKDEHLSHFDHTLNALLLLAYIALKQGDAVGLLSFGGPQRWLAPQKGTYHINTLLNQVYDLHATLEASDYVHVATHLNQRIRKRSLIVLVSNFREEDITELEPCMHLLSQHHLLLTVNLKEEILDTIIDKPIENDAEALLYAETILHLKQRQKLQETMLHKGITAVDTTPKHLATHLVNNYLDIKRSGRL